MAYINVDEVYILDNTGAQVDAVTDIPFKADAGLTDAQKAQARQNLGISAGGGGGGRNLLDNPWFGSGEVVNQRGVTSGSTTNATYFIDRWLTTYGTTVGTYSVGSSGITLTPASSTTATMLQKLANANAIDGKTVTASVMLSNGTIYSGTITRANGTTQVYYNENGVRIRQVTDNAFHIDVSAAKTIRAVKLELGTTSTLANDVPPNYAEELAKCMRYFQRIKGTSTNYAPIGLGFTTSASSGVIAAVLVPLPVPLRATAITVAKSGNLSLLAGSTSYTPSAITYYDHTEQQLRLNVTASGMTAGQFCYLQFSQSAAYIDLSADL